MLVTFFQALIKVYSWVVSPLLGSNCRFSPTCSEYSYQAFEQFGAIKGAHLTVKRLCRCHPWGGSGYDPVPKSQKSDEKHDKST